MTEERTSGMRDMFDDAASAVSLLSVVPTGSVRPAGPRPGVAAWFPAVGLALGATGWGAVHMLRLAGWAGGSALVVGALIVGGWALLTRFLHWDGLADVADGLWGGNTPERRLEIMSDSVIGSFGAAALVLVGVIEIAAVAGLSASGALLPVLVAPALARLSATCAAWLGRPARGSGLGRSVMGRPTPLQIVVTGSIVVGCGAALTYGYGASGAVFASLGVVLALGVPHLLSGPVEGVTGDIMGASVMLCEAALLATAAIIWGV